jgi:hypothetical protein
MLNGHASTAAASHHRGAGHPAQAEHGRKELGELEGVEAHHGATLPPRWRSLDGQGGEQGAQRRRAGRAGGAPPRSLDGREPGDEAHHGFVLEECAAELMGCVSYAYWN